MIELLIMLALVGLVAWVLTRLVPMPNEVRTVIIVVAVLLCLLIVWRAIGGGDIAVPTLRG
jgi:hypothetical protein